MDSNSTEKGFGSTGVRRNSKIPTPLAVGDGDKSRAREFPTGLQSANKSSSFAGLQSFGSLGSMSSLFGSESGAGTPGLAGTRRNSIISFKTSGPHTPVPLPKRMVRNEQAFHSEPLSPPALGSHCIHLLHAMTSRAAPSQASPYATAVLHGYKASDLPSVLFTTPGPLRRSVPPSQRPPVGHGRASSRLR